jgi:hypothetical protein
VPLERKPTELTVAAITRKCLFKDLMRLSQDLPFFNVSKTLSSETRQIAF